MSNPLHDPDVSTPDRLRLLAAGRPIVMDERLAMWLRAVALKFEEMERALDEYVDAAQVDLLLAQRKIAEPASREWLQARNEAIAAGKVVPLVRLGNMEALACFTS